MRVFDLILLGKLIGEHALLDVHDSVVFFAVTLGQSLLLLHCSVPLQVTVRTALRLVIFLQLAVVHLVQLELFAGFEGVAGVLPTDALLLVKAFLVRVIEVNVLELRVHSWRLLLSYG